jgi:tetratricopeptide (TPR) repeat protein
MAASKKNKGKTLSSVLEEIDKPLYEGRWQDVQTLLKKMEKKKSVPPCIPPLVQALEQVEDHMTERKSSLPLSEVDHLLKTALEKCSIEDDGERIQTMIRIKQGQLAWLTNNMDIALNIFPQISSIPVDNTPVHTSKVYMEGFLYKGMCIELLHGEDPSPAVVAYEEALRLAVDIITLHGPFVHISVFHVIRATIQRGSLLCMRLKDPTRAMKFFRKVLMTKEEHILPQLRQICATNLTICLLFLISPGPYTPFTFSQTTYTPSSLSEELILTSIITKTFLGTLTDTKPNDASALFDIMTLVFTDSRLPGLLVQMLEDSAPFMSSCPHLWVQFALALVSNNLHQQAEAVYHECVRLFPCDPLVILLASKHVLESSAKPELSLKWIENHLGHFSGHFLEPKLYYTLGEAQFKLSEKEITYKKTQSLIKMSLESFQRAMDLDPQNGDFMLRYAVQLAIAREIPAAFEHVQKALNICQDQSSCLHLLALLFSANKVYSEALRTCDLALAKDSNNLNLIKTKILLQMVVTGPQTALQSCKQLLKVWQKTHSEDKGGLIDAITQDQHSLSELQSKAITRDDVPYTMSPDVMSDTGSSHFSLSTTSPSLSPPVLMQANIWCTIAEVFIKCKKYSDASLCIQEAQFLAPYLPTVSITNAHILEQEDQPSLARDQYNNALVLKPYNVQALIGMGRLLYGSGKKEESEKCFREALNIDRLDHEAWYWLGKLFADCNEHDRAADCFQTAIQFEQTCPIQPFEAVLHKDNVLM